MIYTKLSIIVKTIRLRYAIPFVFLLVVAYWLGIHPWMANWGSTAAERLMALPGDEILSNNAMHTTMAVSINASPEVIWQWLVQIGQDRAGFYSYTWLENLIGANIHNVDTIHSEWQHLEVGDSWRMVPADYLGGVGKGAASKVLMIEPSHTLVLEMWGAYHIVPINGATSRLIVRGEAGPASLMSVMFVDPLVFTMGKRMLLGLQARAEGLLDVPAGWVAISWLGWSAAGIVVAGLFLSQRRRLPWLALPVLTALPALLMAHDIQAGLAAFLAAGIPLLGFLIFGRSWWGALLIIGSVVMLTLLLAPEAFTAFGLTFALLLLAVLGATVAGHMGYHHAQSSPRARTA